jgi:phosphatidylglycerophosphate synthase
MSGKKVPEYYEDPFDNFLGIYVKKLNPYFKKINFTPNGITTLSFLFGLLTIYLYLDRKYILSALSLLISYFFDCMDGDYARTYKMTSKFGDIYDHSTDFIIIALGVYVFTTNKNIYTNFKIVSVVIFFLFGFLSLYYYICEQKYIKENDDSKEDIMINKTLLKCKNTKSLAILKYFGPGMLSLLVIIIIFLHYFFIKK